jgi:anti-sigma factor RsiW
MNDCDRFVGQVSDYLEGFLTGKQREAFEAHLRSCTACEWRLQRTQALCKRLRALPRVKTSADFDTVLRARIGFERRLKHQGVAGWFSVWPVKVSFYGAAAALVIIATVLVRQEISGSSELEPRREALGSAATIPERPTHVPQVVFPIDAIAPSPIGSPGTPNTTLQPRSPVDSAEVQQRLNSFEGRIQAVHVRM